MGTKTILASAILGTAMMGTAPVQASYTSNCNKLISAWNACKESGGACKAETKRIQEECKCHRLRQGSWKLVTAAVGKDGVCAPRLIKDPPPPPPEPPHRKPVITYGGERGPEGRPNQGPDRKDDQ